MINPGLLIAVSTYGFLKLPKLRSLWVSAISCSTLVLLSGVKDIIRSFTNKNSLHSLINNLQAILLKIRKFFKLLQQENTIINSKEKFLNSRYCIKIITLCFSSNIYIYILHVY